MRTTKEIIEILRQSKPASDKPDIKELAELYKLIEEGMEILEKLDEMGSPKQKEEYIQKIYNLKRGELKRGEIEALEDAYVNVQIEMGEYKKANQCLRMMLSTSEIEPVNYYVIDKLILTERKLGHIDMAKQLATVVLQKDPKHIKARNELIRISMIEGDNNQARELIGKQKEFYEKMKKSRTEAMSSHIKDEQETLELEARLNGQYCRTENNLE